jgi:putative Mg2+ transporter-C (MgtC) family protein
MESFHAAASLLDVVARLALAAVAGAIVGVNRELQQKPAGLRTHALVGMGGALMIVVALSIPGDAAAASAAVSRVMQGMIAGIGFIGGGAILFRGDSKGVHGLTTAAAIWVVTAVGMAIGAGMWKTGLTAAVLTLVVLTGGEHVDDWLHRRSGTPTDPD